MKQNTTSRSPGPLYSPVRLDREYFSGKALDRWQEKHAKLWRETSAARKEGLLDDLRTLVRYLEVSLAVHSPALLADYACGLAVLASARHLPADYVASLLAALGEVSGKELPPDYRKEAELVLRKSSAALALSPPGIVSPGIDDENPFAPLARAYLDALLRADMDAATAIVTDAPGSETLVRDVYLGIIQPALRETGLLWQQGKITIAQEHYVSAATQAVIARLHDQVLASQKKEKRKRKTLVAACVADELHDIGIRMVADFFAMDGWDTYYVGANTPAGSLIAAVRDRSADVVAISSTMAFHIPAVHYLIRSLRADPETEKVKIIVGGYPFGIVPGLWKQVGADACARDADEAVAAADRMVGEGR